MRESPILIGYIWLVCNEIIEDVLYLTIGSLRNRLASVAKTRKMNLGAPSSMPTPEVARPKL